MSNKNNSFFSNKTVLVTGGAGFIGSHIVEQLIAHGATVRVLDDLSTGDIENLTGVADKIEFIDGDIRDYQTCQQAVNQCDIVYHLAALVSVPESMESPLACHAINVTGTQNMLEAARHAGVTRFIFSSSSAVYGPVDGLCSEDMIPNPMSLYGTSKLIGEQLCQAYANQFDTNLGTIEMGTIAMGTIALRYFNVFGDRQKDDSPYSGVMAQFRKCIAENRPVTLYGDGSQTRDFVSVHDVAAANIALSMLPKNELNGKSVNVASGSSISLLELYKNMAADHPDYHQEIIFKSARTGDIKHSSASCSRLNALRDRQA